MAIATLLIIAFTGFFTYIGFQSREFTERYIFDPRYVLVNKDYYRIISSAFLHVDWQHLVFNMLTLYFFGSGIELRYGLAQFLLIYVASIAGGSLLSLYLHRNHEYRAVGASGGVCGVLFSSIFLFPGGSIYMFFIPIPIPTWLFAIVYLGYTFRGIKTNRDNIGHDAHLGGVIMGMLVTTVLYPAIIKSSPLLYAAVLLSVAVFLFVLLKGPVLHLASLKALFSPSKQRQMEPMAHRYAKADKVKQREVDRILEKISEHGFDSLTREERVFLDRFSKRK